MVGMTTLLLLWVTHILSRGTPTGLLLTRYMIELPAAALNRVKRVHVAIAFVVVLLAVLHVWAEDGDRIRMIGVAAPELALWLTSVEISAVVEMVAAIGATWTALRSLDVRSVLQPGVLRFRQRSAGLQGRDRGRRAGRRVTIANDDEDSRAMTCVAA